MDTFMEDLNSPLYKETSQRAIHEVVDGGRVHRQCVMAFSSEGFDFEYLKRPGVEGEGSAVMQRPGSSSSSLTTGIAKPRQSCEGLLQSRDCRTSSSAEEDPWSKLSDDVMENILARLPLFPLKTSKKVCKRWHAVTTTPEFEALHVELGEPQPWLVCYGMNYLVPNKSYAFAFNHESNAWITLPPLHFPAHNLGSLAGFNRLLTAVAGPGENRLKYKLTETASTSSSFADHWCETPMMAFPRYTPVVGVEHRTGRSGTGHKIVVAGGVPDFEPEHMAVEVFDSETGAWEVMENLPADFTGCCSRLWMSGAMCNGNFYLSLIHSWSIHALNLSTNTWRPIHCKRPFGLIYHHILVIGTTLVMVGLCRDANSSENTVKVWKVDSNNSQEFTEIGDMPRSLFNTLDRSTEGEPKLDFLVNENILYVYNFTQDRVVITGEISLEECSTEWQLLPSLPTLGYRFDNMVVFCTSMSVSPES